MMLPLTRTNPYLRDLKIRQRWLEENARESSIFEGARGLPGGSLDHASRKRRPIASTKKSVKAA
jgi:hypothetical protein